MMIITTPSVVLPLTKENVGIVFKTGGLKTRRAGFSSFAEELSVPENLVKDPLRAASWWVTKGRDRRWRVIIFTLDWIGKTEIANELMPYSEPPSGV